MENKREFMKPRGKIRGGIEPGHFKSTMDCETKIMPAPSLVTIPLSQHIGAPCTPTVSIGDKVFVGTKIGDCEKLISAPIHSSVSGTVTAIKEIEIAGGNTSTAVVIENDGQNTPDPTIKPPVINTADDLVAAVREMGLVGLGGAGFPAHVKLRVSPDKPLDTLIINGAECEPFITSDYRECLEDTDDILTGVYTLLKIMDFTEVIIAVEDNKPKALKRLYDVAADAHDLDNRVKIMKIKTHYPQGAEKVLIYSAIGRKLGAGKLPVDVGCVVMNVTSVGALGNYIKTGMPLTHKRLTVDGDLVKTPSNVLVPLGASVEEVLDFCGGLTAEPCKLLMGGPMMGVALSSASVPVLKQNNAILAFSKKMAALTTPDPCIRCGRCAAACPMGLVPFHIAPAAKSGDKQALHSLYADYCMECGSCAFSCPSKRPIVEVMRKAKALLK